MQPGRHRLLAVALGGVKVDLYIRDSDRLLWEGASRRYAPFLRAGDSGWRTFVNARGAGQAPDEGFAYRFNGSSLHLGATEAHLRGVHNEFLLDSLLRVLLSMLLLEHQGLLLHAATIIRAGRAFVFMGKSGAGKSTVSALSPGGTVVTDEITLLRFVDRTWYAYGTPFWGEFRSAGVNQRFPLAGIYALIQSTKDHAERLPSGTGLRALLPNVLFFANGKPETEQLLRLCAALVEGSPFFNLRFRRDASFWEVVA